MKNYDAFSYFSELTIPMAAHGLALEDSILEEWLFSQENTRHTVTLPLNCSQELAALSLGVLPALSANGMIEFYQVMYSRVVKFTSFIKEFNNLQPSDMKFLLSHNLEPMVIVRLAASFNPLSTISQLKELGRPGVHMGSQKIKIGEFFFSNLKRPIFQKGHTTFINSSSNFEHRDRR